MPRRPLPRGWTRTPKAHRRRPASCRRCPALGRPGRGRDRPALPGPPARPEALRQRLLFDADLFESVPDSAPRDRDNAHEAGGINLNSNGIR